MRKLIVGLLVLVVLLVGADITLRYLATNRIGDAIATRLGLAESPPVSIAGFPFVLQAINGEYNTISTKLPPTTFGPVAQVGVDVDLLGVRIPLRDALDGNVSALTANSSQVRISIPAASIAAAVGLPDLQLQQQGSAVGLTVNLTVLGQLYPVTATVDASIVDNAIVLSGAAVSGVGVTLPAAVTSEIGPLLNLSIPLANLPFTISQASFTVAAGALIVDATTSALNFAAAG